MPTTRFRRAAATSARCRVGQRERPGTPVGHRSGRRRALAVVLAAAALAAPAAAQPDAGETADDFREPVQDRTDRLAAQSGTGETAVDALRCWRRVSSNAVYVGERFTMTVTCRLVETDAARIRLDETALEPATLDAAPFEVLSGERFDDVLVGPWRFSQRDYTLRLITETGFGEDVEIPPLDLSYRIERRVGDNPTLAGRELAYVLPAEPVRVLSLVPESADDIRDLPPPGFGEAQARALRASVLEVLAALFGTAAVGLALLGAMHAARARRRAVAPSERRLSPALVARRALDELTRVRRAVAGGGWTPDAAGRALTALRIASAVALSRPVAQTAVAAGEVPRDGQLRVRHGLLGRQTAAVSSRLTAADWRAPGRVGAVRVADGGSPAGGATPSGGDAGLGADGAGLRAGGDASLTDSAAQRADADKSLASGTAPPDAGAGLPADDDAAADLGRAMALLTAFRYRRGDEATVPDVHPDALTRALDVGIVHVTRLRWRALAPVRRAGVWADAVRREWTRLTNEAPWKR